MSASQAPSDSNSTPVDGLTIGQVLRVSAQNYSNSDAVVFCNLNVRMTWRELDNIVDRAARGLLALGFKPGDHFALWATNVPEWVILQFATARIGVVLVNINPAYRAGELKYALWQSEVRGLALIDSFKSSNYFDMVGELCPELSSAPIGEPHCGAFPKLKWVISLRGQSPPGALSWNDLLARADSVSHNRLDEIAAGLSADDPINIQFTSGTTGNPKGAMLSHRNVLLNAYYSGAFQAFEHTDRLCIPVPLYHCFGCVLASLCCLVHGTAMVFPAECFDPGSTLAAVEAERCTAIYGVPTMFIAQFEHQDFPRRKLSSLRTGIMAGSPCPIELMKRVVKEMGAREMTVGYGQTESSPIITMSMASDPIELRVGTIGKPIPGVEVKIVDAETGAELPDERQGELCCRGHNVMIGYYNLPEKTAEAIDADGWLHTGDLALRQPNGYYRITGRLRDMIIRGGENVYPREIEELLYQHPAVQDVQVVGVPDRRYGEEVVAWIRLKSGAAVTEDELREFCRRSLAHFKAPRHWKFVDSFPTTVTGKVQKFKIREQAIKDLGLEDVAKIETA